MSFSLRAGKSETLKWFQDNEVKIQRIVDIGAGSGTYIKLIKEEAGCCQQAEWIGIEIWSPYIQQFNLEKRYDKIINQDVRTIDWNQFGSISAVIAGDVLEHMTKQEAMAVVERVLAVSSMLIVSIPIRYMPQDEHAYENPHEAHVKDDWTHEEVMETWGSVIVNHWRKSPKSKLGVYWMSRANS